MPPAVKSALTPPAPLPTPKGPPIPSGSSSFTVWATPVTGSTPGSPGTGPVSPPSQSGAPTVKSGLPDSKGVETMRPVSPPPSTSLATTAEISGGVSSATKPGISPPQTTTGGGGGSGELNDNYFSSVEKVDNNSVSNDKSSGDSSAFAGIAAVGVALFYAFTQQTGDNMQFSLPSMQVERVLPNIRSTEVNPFAPSSREDTSNTITEEVTEKSQSAPFEAIAPPVPMPSAENEARLKVEEEKLAKEAQRLAIEREVAEKAAENAEVHIPS